MTLFDWINQILVHKKDWDSFEESEHKSSLNSRCPVLLVKDSNITRFATVQ